MNRNEEKKFSPVIITLVRIILPFLIIALSAAGYFWMQKTKPQHRRRAVEERSVSIEIMKATISARNVTVYATGTVIPAVRLSLKSRVSGQIVMVSDNLEAGCLLHSGETAIRLDRIDFEASAADKKAKLAAAEYAYKMELGQQQVAKHEWELLENKSKITDLEKELILRKPHLEKSLADLASAKAGLSSALLDLERTEILIPFNAVVISNTAVSGMLVTSQSILSELAGSDEYWVSATVSSSSLKLLKFRDQSPGASVKIRSSGSMKNTHTWNGELLRLQPELETKGRLAQITVAVPEPLKSGEFPLLLGSFVDLEISGGIIENVFVLPQKAIHDGDTVWLVNQEKRLEMRKVEIVYMDQESVLIRSGLSEGESIITTQITSPVPGLKLRLPSDSPLNKADSQHGEKK